MRSPGVGIALLALLAVAASVQADIEIAELDAEVRAPLSIARNSSSQTTATAGSLQGLARAFLQPN